MLSLLVLQKYTPAGVGTDQTAAGAIDFTTERVFASATHHRYARIQAHDGDLMVSLGNSVTATAPLSPPIAGGLRVFAGTAEVFQLPPGGTPSVRVWAVGAVGHGSFIWGD